MNPFRIGDFVQTRQSGIGKLIVAVDRECVYAMHPFSAETDISHCCHYYLPNSVGQFKNGDEIEFIPGRYPDKPKEYIHLGDKIHRTFYQVLAKTNTKKGLYDIDRSLVSAFAPGMRLVVSDVIVTDKDRPRVLVKMFFGGRGIANAVFSMNQFRVKQKVETPFVDLASYSGFPDRYRHWKLGPEYEELCENVGPLPIISNPLNLLPLEDCTKLTNHARYIQDKITKLVDDTNFDYVRPFYTGASKRQNIFARKLEGIKNAIRRYFA